MILFQVGAQMADLRYHVLWSRRWLSCLCGVLGTDLLISYPRMSLIQS